MIQVRSAVAWEGFGVEYRVIKEYGVVMVTEMFYTLIMMMIRRMSLSKLIKLYT